MACFPNQRNNGPWAFRWCGVDAESPLRPAVERLEAATTRRRSEAWSGMAGAALTPHSPCSGSVNVVCLHILFQAVTENNFFKNAFHLYSLKGEDDTVVLIFILQMILQKEYMLIKINPENTKTSLLFSLLLLLLSHLPLTYGNVNFKMVVWFCEEEETWEGLRQMDE